MKIGRGERVALVTVAVGLAVLIATVYTFRDRIREEYWLYRLEHGDSSVRWAAAKRLGEIGSLRAVPTLLGDATIPFLDEEGRAEGGPLVQIYRRRGRAMIPMVENALRGHGRVEGDRLLPLLSWLRPDSMRLLRVIADLLREQCREPGAPAPINFSVALVCMGRAVLVPLIETLPDESWCFREQAGLAIAVLHGNKDLNPMRRAGAALQNDSDLMRLLADVASQPAEPDDVRCAAARAIEEISRSDAAPR